MQPIETPIKNVTVCAYFNPLEPLEEVVITGASGTYSVGTLTVNVFYNLNLTSVDKLLEKLTVHGRYFATWENSDGSIFTSPWMYCTDNSKAPKFGRTVTLFDSKGETQNLGLISGSIDSTKYIKLSSLNDITVSQFYSGSAIGSKVLIENGKGNIIATKIGTPHLMGVDITEGTKVGSLIVGMKDIAISGKTDKGESYTQTGLTVVSLGEDVVLIKEFF